MAASILVAATLLLWRVLQVSESTLLGGTAQHAALRWAEHFARHVPDIEFLLDGDPPSVLAQEHLGALRGAGDVLRFDLFSADGRLRLRSESLGGLSSLDQGKVDPMAAEVSRSGASRSGIERGGGPNGQDGQNDPVLLGHAYVPIRVGDRTPGALRIEVDHSTQVTAVRAAFAKIGAAVGAMVLALGGLGFWARRRIHRSESAVDDHLRYLATHDGMTGLANRASFRQALERACQPRDRAGHAGVAVLCVDLDRFKEVNDSLGHAAGDEMLRQVAARLSALVRSGDVVARLGGDEFALLQARVGSADEAASLAARITTTLAEPYELAGQRVLAGASVGAALFGVDGSDAETLLLRADAALYAAKAKGRGTWAFFDPELERQREHRRRLTQDLRAALEGDGLSMDFQPLYENDGRTLRGYEALARWHHPGIGTISPAVFVPLAEETGLIVALGNWALRYACRQAASWPGELSVAVNLSAAHFRDAKVLTDEVRAALSDAGLAPCQLEIEITESLLIGDTDNALRCLYALHDLGVHIALDDFGTGFSSLAYLWRFPFDKVKIDRVFTQGLGRDDKVTLIVRSIVSLAHELHIRVNAEGIETESQMDLLREYGCDELQGFLLGRPGQVDVGRQSGGHATPRPFAARTDFTSLSTLPAPLDGAAAAGP